MSSHFMMRATAFTVGCLLGVIAGCNDNSDIVEIVEDGEQGVLSLKLSVNDTTLAVGQTFALTANAVLDNGELTTLDSDVTWRSGNTNVATVSSDGVVTAVAPGVANITHRWRRISGTTRIEVTQAELASISFSNSPIDASVCSEQSVTATGIYTDGSGRALGPQSIWSSQSNDIAMIRSQTNSQADLFFVGGGTTAVSLTSGSISSELVVSVANTLERLSFGSAELTLETGDSQVVSVTGEYSDGTQGAIEGLANYSFFSDTFNGSPSSVQSTTTHDVTLTGSLEAQLILTPDGSISLSAARAGSINLRASCGGQEAVLAVNVVEPPVVTSLSFENTVTDIAPGEQLTLPLSARYSDGSTQDVSALARWSLASGDVHSFQLNSATGLLTADSDNVIERSVVVRGKFEDATDTVEIVTNRGIEKAVVQTKLFYVDSTGKNVPATAGLSFYAGDSVQLKLQSTYNTDEQDFSLNDLFWSNVNPQIASVDASGLLRLHAAGTATVLAIRGNQVATLQLMVIDSQGPAAR